MEILILFLWGPYENNSKFIAKSIMCQLLNLQVPFVSFKMAQMQKIPLKEIFTPMWEYTFSKSYWNELSNIKINPKIKFQIKVKKWNVK